MPGARGVLVSFRDRLRLFSNKDVFRVYLQVPGFTHGEVMRGYGGAGTAAETLAEILCVRCCEVESRERVGCMLDCAKKDDDSEVQS